MTSLVHILVLFCVIQYNDTITTTTTNNNFTAQRAFTRGKRKGKRERRHICLNNVMQSLPEIAQQKFCTERTCLC